MKILCLSIFLLAFCIMPQVTQAHPGHYDKLGLDEVIDVGKIMIKQIVSGGSIAETWKESSEFNYDLSDGFIKIKGKKRWVVAYENLLETDPSKRLIRIIMTPKGKFVAFEFIETTAMPRPQDLDEW